MAKKKHIEFIDLFCGGGGSGSGIVEALELLDLPHHGTFINHSAEALAIHKDNHSVHDHYKEDIVKLDPNKYMSEEDVTLLWASPECTHFSIAKGSSPKDPQSRAQADSVLDWVSMRQPKVLLLENVAEFVYWGPVIHKKDPDTGKLVYSAGRKTFTKLRRGLGRRRGESVEDHWERLLESGVTPQLIPDPTRRCEYFNRWVKDLAGLGYKVDYRILCAADYGGCTIRKRLFVQAVRIDSGLRLIWPKPCRYDTKSAAYRGKLAPVGLKPWRSVKEIIDFSNVGTSIFNRPRPMSPVTIRRMAKGLLKYGFKDFIIPKDQGWDKGNIRSLFEPVSTITRNHRGEQFVTCVLQDLQNGICYPVVNLGNVKLAGDLPGFRESIDSAGGCEATRSFLLEDDLMLSNLMLDQEKESSETSLALFRALRDEIREGKIRAIRPWLYLYFSNGPEGSDIDAPCGTVKGKNHISLCYPVVSMQGKHFLLDIKSRPLNSDELAAAQGFTPDYKWNCTHTAKVNAIGNSVERHVARALTLAVLTQEEDITKWTEKS